ADVLLNTTAVLETSGKAFLAFRAERVPQPSYMTRLLWITNYRGFAASRLRDRRIPGASLLKYPVAVGLWSADAARATAALSGPRDTGDDGDRASRSAALSGPRLVADFDERFDRFWAEQRRRRDRLQAIRDRRTLAWRFALERERPLILVHEQDGIVDGYAVLVHRAEGDLRRAEVADLQALDDDPAVLRGL